MIKREKKIQFQFFGQSHFAGCGPACMLMIANYYGKQSTIEYINRISAFEKDGISLFDLGEAAVKMGFKVKGIKVSCEVLVKEGQFPCILHWNSNHFVVLMSVLKKGDQLYFEIADPANRILRLSKSNFERHWARSISINGQRVGTALIINK